jgi:hypothetical protein
MPDPLRAKLVSESASGMAGASISPPEATRDRVLFACFTCYEMLRFPGFLDLVQSEVTKAREIHLF